MFGLISFCYQLAIYLYHLLSYFNALLYLLPLFFECDFVSQMLMLSNMSCSTTARSLEEEELTECLNEGFNFTRCFIISIRISRKLIPRNLSKYLINYACGSLHFNENGRASAGFDQSRPVHDCASKRGCYESCYSDQRCS